LPSPKNINSLEVAVYHSPIDKNGFKDAKLLTKDKISSDDLIGYHEYLRQTQEPNYYIPIANEYYQAGLRLTDEKKHYDAIDSYSKAVDLMPNFFEAIDNRAFCKMDLGQWAEAIEDFQESLEVNPNSLLAEFSIGECYLKMDNYKEAKEQFEKAIAIDPTHQAPKDFLKKVNELLSA
jgi:tetratricopeptide (TPR) repeat protein